MDAERTIAEIGGVARMFAAPDARPLSLSDLSGANRRNDEMLAHSPVVSALAVLRSLLPKRVSETLFSEIEG
jgi:hypothetical protein